MKIIYLLIFIYLASLTATPVYACSTKEHTQPQLRLFLLKLLAADQADRQILFDRGIQNLTPQDVTQIQEGDRLRHTQLVELMAKYGWPTRKMVCADGVKAAFIMVQHADTAPTFQLAMLKHIEAAYKAGEIPGEALALLTDRVLKNTGQPQRFGTQVLLKANRIEVYDLEAPEQVDQRRASLGLPPLAEYLAQLKEFYKITDDAKPQN